MKNLLFLLSAVVLISCQPSQPDSQPSQPDSQSSQPDSQPSQPDSQPSQLDRCIKANTYTNNFKTKYLSYKNKMLDIYQDGQPSLTDEVAVVDSFLSLLNPLEKSVKECSAAVPKYGFLYEHLTLTDIESCSKKNEPKEYATKFCNSQGIY